MPIQQHPLPQDISSYRFRLIGDMTIKQFGMLAGGIVLAIIAYSLPLPFFFKYPLSFVFLALGAGSAFLPIQGRPLDQWIIAFIRSIYAPTQYVWKQSNVETQTSATSAQSVVPTTLPVQAAPKPVTVAASIPTPTPQGPTTVSPLFAQKTAELSAVPNTINPTKETPKTDQFATPAPSAPVPQAASTQAETTNLPIPFTPTTPNTLVGLTLSFQGKISDGVLVEIQSRGLTIRATKSNKLGQFLFARPLENGQYQIIAEKEGTHFPVFSIDLRGEIVKPLKIQADT